MYKDRTKDTHTLKTVKMYMAEPKITVTQQKTKLKGKKIIKIGQVYHIQYFMSTVL